jgi:hypothetical protein
MDGLESPSYGMWWGRFRLEDGFMRRVVLIAGFFALALAGCHSKPSPPPGGARGSKADAARKQAEALARDAVIGAASEVQARAEPRRGGSGWFVKAAQLAVEAAVVKDALTSEVGAQQPPRSPTPPATTKAPAKEPARFGGRSPIREVVWNQLPSATESEAESDVLGVAQETIERRLAELDPPVYYRPTANEVKNEFLRRDTRYSSTLSKVTGDEARVRRAEEMRTLFTGAFEGNSTEKVANLYYTEYTVEVTADQVRELRTRDRLADSLRMLGLVTAAAVAGLMFLRLDQWTRGHLTRLLAIAAVTLAAAAAVGLYLL